jgi:hypothetical protein
VQGGESGKATLVPGHPHASQLISRVLSKDEDERMPPKGQGLKPEQIAVLEEWVKSGAPWPKPPVSAADVAPSPRLDDAAFLRRLSLDLTGVGPTPADLADFLADQRANKRELQIDRLLASPQWADSWMPYWMDVLAENPTLINPTLNTTGPFRWFLLEALRDNKPADRFVTELLMLRGSSHTGGSAGFGLAGESDSPFASKGQIIASAFLGVELQCARCHDSPYHSTKPADLYALATQLDDVADDIEEVADFMALYKIEAPMDQGKVLAEILSASCDQLAAALAGLRTGEDLEQRWVEIHRLENEGDRVWREALASLFSDGIDPMVVIRWKDIFGVLERAIDATETAAHHIESIVVKRS